MNDNIYAGTTTEADYQHAAGHAFAASDLAGTVHAHIDADDTGSAIIALAGAVGLLADALAQMCVTEASMSVARADAHRASARLHG